MTLDEQDVLSAALKRLCAALTCLGEGHTEGMAFEGFLFVLSDVKKELSAMLEAPADEKKAAYAAKSLQAKPAGQRARVISPHLSVWGRKPEAE